jgi:membrane protease subunit HflC
MKSLGIIVIAGIMLLLANSLYTVKETEQVIITQFGRPIGEAVTTAGLKFKMPFIQQINSIEKRILEWDGSPSNMPTKDKLYIAVFHGVHNVRTSLMDFANIFDLYALLS